MVVRRRKTLRPRTAASLARYGLTVQEWQAMIDAQGGVCLICRRGGKVRHLSVDHDHTIEKKFGEIVVRALLCSRCNSALGKFEWADDVLERLMQYIQEILLTRARYEDYIEDPEADIDQRQEAS